MPGKDESPLAEGRELKYASGAKSSCDASSPLAEGRELKYNLVPHYHGLVQSPLAEGRELKLRSTSAVAMTAHVAPRGGA